jgi:hypothetical protein
MIDYTKPIEYLDIFGHALPAHCAYVMRNGNALVVVDPGEAEFVRIGLPDGETARPGEYGNSGTVRNIPQPPAFRVDAPGQYIQRDGGIATVKHIVPSAERYHPDDTRYPVRGQNASGCNVTWAEDGRAWKFGDVTTDLIAKAPQPPTRIEAPGIIPQRDGRDAWVREIVPLEIDYPVRGVDADGDEAVWTLEGIAIIGDECDEDLMPESR